MTSATAETAAPRVLVRAGERGPAHAASHPYNPASEVHGWTVSREAGLGRIAVNLAWIPPGKESAIFHRHHREEEWAFFLEGRGVVELEDEECEVEAGDFVAFPPGVAHLVRNPSGERLLFLEGGEIIPDVEVADFPRLKRRLVRFGNRFAVYPMEAEIEFFPGVKEFPPEMFGIEPVCDGPRLVVRAAERPELRTYHHPQNPRSEVKLSWLSRPALKRISAGIAVVSAGRESFVKHVHLGNEEWMYVLSGQGIAEIGDREERIGPGDFLGFPARAQPHNVRASDGGELVYLQGGDAWSKTSLEIVDFPDLGLRKNFIGTRLSTTFRLDSALERGEK